MAAMVVREIGVSSAMHAEVDVVWAGAMFARHWIEE